MNMKLLTVLIIATLMATSASASSDDALREQCQYLVYGNGTNSKFFSAALTGVVVGIQYMVLEADRTKLTTTASRVTIRLKACQKALVNIGSYGFEDDYKGEVLKLVSKKYADK